MAKILVVDDEPDAVELVEFNLKNAGFEVITAGDGAEAIKKRRTCRAVVFVARLRNDIRRVPYTICLQEAIPHAALLYCLHCFFCLLRITTCSTRPTVGKCTPLLLAVGYREGSTTDSIRRYDSIKYSISLVRSAILHLV